MIITAHANNTKAINVKLNQAEYEKIKVVARTQFEKETGRNVVKGAADIGTFKEIMQEKVRDYLDQRVATTPFPNDKQYRFAKIFENYACIYTELLWED